MRIAIIKLAALGDVLRTTCLLKPLKRRFPEAEIWWYTLAAAAPLLEKHPLISRLVALDPRQRSATWPAAEFDWILGLDEDEQACRLSGALKGKRRFGARREPDGRTVYSDDSRPWFDMGLLHRDPDGTLATANRLKAANTRTYPQILFDMLRLDARPGEGRPDLAPDPGEDALAREWLRAAGASEKDFVVGLNTGAGARWRTKQLSIEKTLSLLRALSNRFPEAKWMLLGGPEETERNRLLLERSPVPLIDAGTSNTLPRFISLIGLCRGVLTSDSLALHIAVARQKPVVAFFGSTSAAEIELGPRGVRWLPETPCRCYYKPVCEQAAFCLDALTPEAAADAIADWLN